jgi:branched-subunit amino acid transport protein
MSTGTWLALIGGCTVVTFVIKAFGPVAMGGRGLPRWFASVVTLMAPALLAALIATQALANGDEWAIGADTAGTAVAGIALWRGVSIVVAVVVAAGVAAALRAVT